MPERKQFIITRTVTYQTEHSAYSREVIRDLLDMNAPFAWNEVYKEETIKEKGEQRYETKKEGSER